MNRHGTVREREREGLQISWSENWETRTRLQRSIRVSRWRGFLRSMPLVESGALGQSPSPTSSCSSTKKIKKKQAKEERDKQRQAEKKRRRLEKALANATALRIELEKKKQKRKEEEQRLDEEGAALAESVALQVLVDEDRGNHCVDSNFSEAENLDEINSHPYQNTEQLTAAQQINNSWSPFRELECKSMSDCFDNYIISNAMLDMKDEESDDEEDDDGGSGSCNGGESSLEDPRMTNKRVRDAELAAGLAAARAVAALKIAEEARAEAEAARIAAEISASENRSVPFITDLEPHLHHSMQQAKSAEEERDELKVQVLEMKQALQEKNKKVAQLEQDLEYLKQYVTQCKVLRSTSNGNVCLEMTLKRVHEVSTLTITKSFTDSGDSWIEE